MRIGYWDDQWAVVTFLEKNYALTSNDKVEQVSKEYFQKPVTIIQLKIDSRLREELIRILKHVINEHS